jgi:hypothetical protein
MGTTIEARANEPLPKARGTGGGGGPRDPFHRRSDPERHERMLRTARRAVGRNMAVVFALTCAVNVLVLAIPIYLFQISDRVLTSRSVDTLVMLTAIIVGAIVFQSIFDAIRRHILMRTAVEVATRLGAPSSRPRPTPRCTGRGANTRRWAISRRCGAFSPRARSSPSWTCPSRRSSSSRSSSSTPTSG